MECKCIASNMKLKSIVNSSIDLNQSLSFTEFFENAIFTV